MESQDALLLTLQHDTGRWGTEYTWRSENGAGMLGVQVQRNFGRLDNGDYSDESASGTNEGSRTESLSIKRIDEEETMEGGLKGRISAGAEFYASTDKSVGGSPILVMTSLYSLIRNMQSRQAYDSRQYLTLRSTGMPHLLRKHLSLNPPRL